ncbi:MAG TPA: SDR family oxidoreductase, partial [Pyrinomonadaceae bacterium]|nr:SDR family oxidoreductase [Pyrinomonadaceae bacterium]
RRPTDARGARLGGGKVRSALSAGAEKVLLAGASGRLGREILSELNRRGYVVRALVRDTARLEAEEARGVETFVGDARTRAAIAGVCEGASAVVSALGASLQLKYTRDGSGYREVDYLANLNLLAEALKARARKFVYVSLHGADALRGTAYADAHEEFVRELKASGMDYAVVRPTGFFYVFAEFLKMARRGRAVVVGDGSARTNPVHERDVARVCVESLEAPARGEVSVGGPRVYTRREIAELAFRATGRAPKITRAPAPLMRALSLPVRPFDRRLYDLLDFGVAASTVDLVAPQVGTHTLEDYFRMLSEKQ